MPLCIDVVVILNPKDAVDVMDIVTNSVSFNRMLGLPIAVVRHPPARFPRMDSAAGAGLLHEKKRSLIDIPVPLC